MATRKQRAVRYARRVHHGLAAQMRRQDTVRSLPAVASLAEMNRHMEDAGYQQDRRGRWQRSPK
jgi:hypothetical protein